jgi:hypothetical protein
LAALQDLRAHLETHEVHVDPIQVGAVLLALMRAHNWNEKPEALVAWLEDLALDVARNWPHGEIKSPPQSGVDTVPIDELKKIRQSLREQQPKSDKS